MSRLRRIATAACLLGATLLFNTLTEASAEDADMLRFEWTSTNAAPKSYPIELLRAELVLADGTSYSVPDRRAIYHGWGVPGATHFVGEPEKALPVRLIATW
ncbi:MAG: DUF2931 family protein, partial [Pseudomonadota bacterium]